jgi:hypothetical protein
MRLAVYNLEIKPKSVFCILMEELLRAMVAQYTYRSSIASFL